VVLRKFSVVARLSTKWFDGGLEERPKRLVGLMASGSLEFGLALGNVGDDACRQWRRCRGPGADGAFMMPVFRRLPRIKSSAAAMCFHALGDGPAIGSGL